MAKPRVLVVEDDEDILELVRYNLEQEGYRVGCCSSGEECLRLTETEKPDLIVLDVMLPGIDGLEVCRHLKRGPETERIPIIIVSAKGGEADVVVGLELGADDYIAKPFSPRILIARVRAAIRRSETKGRTPGSVLRVRELTMDSGRFEVSVGGRRIDLTPSEFRILELLASHAGWVFTRMQIVDAVKGADYAVTERSVDVQIVGLRKKLGAHEYYIETVRGVGYRFKEAAE